MLEQINSPEDLRKLSIKEKNILAQEIRNYVIDIISKTGGHLASNLGVVELTLAIHSVFDLNKDKVVWDVGHQSYVHKILTGRKEQLKTLRQLNGIAGFPKTCESQTDCFNTGHSSTSISAAMGMAKARDIRKMSLKQQELEKQLVHGEKSKDFLEKLKQVDYSVVAVIGDGALTGGMALEALNHVGSSKTRMIVILNDNEMSISKNIGGINLFLSKLRAKKRYTVSNQSGRKIIEKMPFIGVWIVKAVRKLKRGIKQLIIPKMYFEDIGFKYLGPVDGHNIEDLEELLSSAKELDEPVLIHVITKKGKGYKPAEENPDKFHATGAFDVETGKPIKEKKKDYSKAFGEKLVELAEKNENIVAITAAMKDGTGLKEFANKFPNRYFDVGIAEQHALTFAAGLAKEGMIPFVPIYSSFYQRAYDQVIHDICAQNLPVIMCVDRAGIVGNDGETHQGLFDLAFFKIVPNIVIMAPKDFKELHQMMDFAVELKKPVVIRYPRGGEEDFTFKKHFNIKLGQAEYLKYGKDVTIIAIGKMVTRAMKIALELKNYNIDAEVINARFLKPLDQRKIFDSISKTKLVVTIEDGLLCGGLGSLVKEIIVNKKIPNVKIKCFGYPDKFVQHGSVSEIENIFGLDEKNILNYIKKTIVH